MNHIAPTHSTEELPYRTQSRFSPYTRYTIGRPGSKLRHMLGEALDNVGFKQSAIKQYLRSYGIYPDEFSLNLTLGDLELDVERN